jgi:hypothetical protein
VIFPIGTVCYQRLSCSVLCECCFSISNMYSRTMEGCRQYICSATEFPIQMTCPNRPPGITALGLFFLFGTVMSGLAAAMLMFPRSVLEPLWQLNSRAHEGFAAMGLWAVLLMVAVCVACATAALGLRRCKRWGYWMALAILSINIGGDTIHAVVAHDWRTLVGLPIGGALVVYLVTKRSAFVPRRRVAGN